MNPDFKPQLRPMMLMRTEQDGKRFLIVQDPRRISNTIMLPGEMEPLLLMLNGDNSMRDIQVALTRHSGGEIVPLDNIQNMVGELDSNLLLDSPRFRETRELAESAWNCFRLRKPFHAGQAYDKDPDKLREFIDGFYNHPEGPCPHETGIGLPRGEPAEKRNFARGILAPHIDIHHGGPVFAWAYNEIRTGVSADLYIIFGTAHHPTPGPFSVTRKDYMTPLGILPTDGDFIDLLEKHFSPDWMMKDFAHKDEHSIEFQVLFLQHALGERSDAAILPVLAGFDHPAGDGPPPWEDADAAGFLDALEKAVEDSGKRVAYIVGGDLAHIGPRYGDEKPVMPDDLEKCSKADHKMLEKAAKGDSKGFYNFIANEKDERNICGMPPLYAMLHMLDGQKGEMLSYNYWLDEPTRSAVTFASMAWRE